MQRSYKRTSFKGYGSGYTQRSQGQRTYQAPQRRQFNSTQEEKAEYGDTVKELTNTYFMRGLRLAVLPGGIPCCFAVGRALVTDYEVWNSFKDACQKKAETQAKIEVYNADAAPFTWGVRPVSPVHMHPPHSPETCCSVWAFVLLYVAA